MAERRVHLRTPRWRPYRECSRLLDQAFGMPSLRENLGLFPSSHWPGYMRPGVADPVEDLLNPLQSIMPTLDRLLSKQMTTGLSEIKQSPDNWKVCLDVKHFSPDELRLKTKDGVIEITGKHEEKEDEHGYISRCFTRKYKLPPGAEMDKISSSLSPEGVLTVEAPLPKPAIKATEVNIPITVEKEKMEQDGPMVEQDGPVVEQGGSMMEKGGPVVEQDGAQVQEDGAGMEQDGPVVEQDGAQVQEDGAGMEQDGAGVEQDGAGVEQDGAGVEQDGAGVEQDGAGVEQDGAGMEQDGAGVEQDGAGMEQDGAGMEQDGAEVEKECSGVEQDEITMEKDSPVVEKEGPGVEQDGTVMKNGA